MQGWAWMHHVVHLARSSYLNLSSSRSQLLRQRITHPGDSCRRASLGGLLHQVSLPWRPGRWLLGGKPTCHLLAPQKLHTRRGVLPEKLIPAPHRQRTVCITSTTTPSIPENMLNRIWQTGAAKYVRLLKFFKKKNQNILLKTPKSNWRDKLPSLMALFDESKC